MAEKSFNADIPGSISALRAAMKEFLLRHKLYKILLRGKGLEFEAYRVYAPDDDASTIDWKASMRTNNTLVKQYKDERNLKIVFMVDVSENMVFGSTERIKCEYAAEVVGAFSHLVIGTGDNVGIALFSDKLKSYIAPSRGDKHFHRIVDELVNPETYGGVGDLNVGLDFALEYLGKNIDSVVIVSDLINFDKESKNKLSQLAGKFETVVLRINDPLDKTMPDISGEVIIEDPKTGQQLLVSPKVAREVYEKRANEQAQEIRRVCESNNIDLLEISTDKPFVAYLSSFLKERALKK